MRIARAFRGRSVPPRSPIVLKVLFAALILFGARPAAAQWLTQSIDLKIGWNAVFLHVDASHLDLDDWLGNDVASPINEVWRWTPPAAVQFVDDPQTSIDNVSGWSGWVRTVPESALERMSGDTAYLVKSTATFTWQIKGRPVVPRGAWDIEGLNLIGFSTRRNAAPNFERFLAEAPALQSPEVEVYRYAGPDLDVNNPIRVPSLLYRNTIVRRGQAFWVRSGTVFNTYFGPFEVALAGSQGVNFYSDLGTYSVRLRNLAPRALSVSMELVASETAPTNRTAIAGAPPLLVRGPLDTNTHAHASIALPPGASTSWTLAPRDQEGSEVEVVLGLDRSAITEDIGALLAGVLRFTDSLGLTEVDVPVSATVDSEAGLWVGEALVTQVGQYLKTYQTGAARPIVYTNGTAVVTNNLFIATNGQYIVTGVDTNITDVPKWFPLRLIVHRPDNDPPRLLQRVFYGVGTDGTNSVVARAEAALDPTHLADARRISATHLPWSADTNNVGWAFDGPLAPGALITTQVRTDFNDQASNPFLHTYHPDHDNLDGRFEKEQPQGYESYSVVRNIGLRMRPAQTDFEGRVSGRQRIAGDYAETVQVLGLTRTAGPTDMRSFEVRGVFRLDRISTFPVLVGAPRERR